MGSYKYILERYKIGGSNRYTCPNCGKKKCFTRYQNSETGEYIDDACGKCDHESSCGYHYTPKQFFQDNPSNRKERWQSRPPQITTVKTLQQPQRTIEFIDPIYVERSHSTESVFMKWALSRFSPYDKVHEAFNAYRIGATRSGAVIFWQIDINGRVRTGKRIYYNPDGHRTSYVSFIHKKMENQGILHKNWTATQCLFGEHLLAERPDDVVYLVESEKTAFVCSIYYPQFVWLATGGCKGLKSDKLKPLGGRKVVIIPDSGVLQHWQDIMSECKDIDYRIVKDIEQYPPNTDILDILLNEA